MSGRPIKKSTIDVSTVIRIIDATAGTPETTVDYDTSGIDLWYWREGATKTSITEAALASLDAAHSDGGVEHIGDGYYRLDLPDAACATGVSGVAVGGAVTGMIVIGTYHPLVSYDPEDTVRLGLTALPNAAADAAGGLLVSDAGGLDLDGVLSGNVPQTADHAAGIADIPTVAEFEARTLTAAAYFDPAADEVTTDAASRTASKADVSALATQATADAIEADTAEIGAAGAGLTAIGPVTLANGAHGGAAAALTLADYSDFTGAGATNPNVLLTAEIATVTSQTEFTLATGSDDDNAYNDQAVVLYDDSNSDYPSVRVVSDYTGSTKTVTIDSAPDFTLGTDDSVRVFVTAPGTSAPTAAQVRAEIDSNSTQLAAIVADTNELQTDDVPGLIAALDTVVDRVEADTQDIQTQVGTAGAGLTDLGGMSTAMKAEVNTEADTAISDAGLATASALSTHDGKLDTVDGNVDAILVDTNELQTDWANGGRLDLLLDSVILDIAALENISASDVNAEIVDALATDTHAEPSSAPSATASLEEKISFLAALARNKITQTATTQTLRNDADSANIATASVSDDGTTYTRGEYS